MEIDQRKAKLEKQLSGIVGATVELTIRGLKQFTISAEGNAIMAMQKAKAFTRRARTNPRACDRARRQQ